jgi:beta-aspartyl-peptidase (threonine type)
VCASRDPIIIGSERSEAGLPAGMAVLRDGGSALDAVELALRHCEDNLADHYVGTGGLPNARGEVELDASIMVGSTRAFGAVAALRGYPNPVSVARAVLERLPQHALLFGEGAALFAAECGFTRADLLTDEARRLWREALLSAGRGSRAKTRTRRPGTSSTAGRRWPSCGDSRRTRGRGGRST